MFNLDLYVIVSLKYILYTSHHNPAESFCTIIIIFVYFFDVKLWGQTSSSEDESKGEKKKNQEVSALMVAINNVLLKAA